MKYYIYRLDQKRNKFGNPYYGMTEDLNARTKKWRWVLKDPSIELVVIEEHDDEDYCFEREQEVYRVPNGWKRESHNRKRHRAMSMRGGETRQTDEVKKTMSLFYSGENNPMFGKHHSEEAKNKMSKTRTGMYIGENNPFFGKTHSEEAKKKMSKAHTGKVLSRDHKNKLSGENSPFAKAVVIEYFDGEIKMFNTVKETANYLGMLGTNLTRILSGRKKIYKRLQANGITNIYYK